MENHRTINLLIKFLIGGALLVFPLLTLGYDNITTHPALTQEIIKFFNVSFPDKKIADEEMKLVMQGSIEEDDGARWMYHFYDPIYKRGLVLGREWRSSKDWGQNVLAQAKFDPIFESQSLGGTIGPFFGARTDFTWGRGIYEYAWGDKKRGLETLGHILHLIEDATVPDHTRNDPHPAPLGDASPYESWTAGFNPQNIDIQEQLHGLKPFKFTNINEYFDTVATYSNNNFFSKDTILIKEYDEPKIHKEANEILGDSKMYTFGYTLDKDGMPYRLVKIVHIYGTKTLQYSLEDKDNLILSDYWSHLSKQAVLYGAGVVKLFFNEVAQEKQTKVLYDQNRSWFGKQIDRFKHRAFGVASVFYGITVKSTDLEDISERTAIKEKPFVKRDNQENIVRSASRPATTVAIPKVVDQSKNLAVTAAPSPISNLTNSASRTPPVKSALEPPSASPPPPVPPFVSSITSRELPIAGVAGGGGGGGAQVTASPKDETPPAPPVIISPQNNQKFTVTSVTFNGTAEAGSTVSNNLNNQTAGADNIGNWQITIPNLSEGTSTIQFFAKDQAGNKSGPAAKTIFVDTISPGVSLIINECAQSLATGGDCLIATSTVTLQWSSSASDLDHYIIECDLNGASCPNFNLSSTTATTTIYVLPTDNAVYSFKAKAIDNAGNEGSQQVKTAEFVSRPVVINEIAWAGTSATRDKDEWVELFNRSSKSISLTGIKFKSLTDDKPTIALSGTLAAGAYYLIERTDDNTISDVTASTTSSFGSGSGAGLVNTGEVLALDYNGQILDKTPALNTCNGWCGGSASGNYPSMERVDPDLAGDDYTNWGTNNGAIKNGKNVDNVPIYGTPGKRNYLNYLIVQGDTLSSSKTLKKSKSPYLIKDGITINSGVTLTLEPGTVVKFYDTNSWLIANGAIKALGSSSDKIIFTSFKDDTYGGDLNGDGSATAPQFGDWRAIILQGSGSEFDQTVIRYGGKFFGGNVIGWANLKVKNVSVSIKNSVVEESNFYGLWLDGASGVVDGNIVRNNKNDLAAIGIYATGGSVDIKNNTIQSNAVGLQMESGNTSAVTNNTFTSNTNAAISFNSSYPTFSGNAVNLNGVNGILITGSQNADYTFSAGLPYVISSTYTVLSGNTLTLDPGSIVKFKDTNAALSSPGKILANGSASSPVIFTSIFDDNYGGDTTSNGSTTPQAGDWRRVVLSGGGAASSTLNYLLVRFGGSGGAGAFNVANTSVVFQNSTFENNYARGIWLESSSATRIENSTIRDHRSPDPGEPTGLYLKDSSPALTNVTFNNNKFGIMTEGVSSVTNGGGIVFTNNTTNTMPGNLVP